MLGKGVLDFLAILSFVFCLEAMFPSSMQTGLETFRCIVEVGLAGVGFAFLPSLGWG